MFKKLYFLWKQRSFWQLSKKSPEEIFTDVYKGNVWGGEEGTFYSGSGSINPNTEIYIKNLVDFIHKNNISSVVDLGCGDFRIMKQVIDQTSVTYTGIDVVKPLIEHNSKKFSNDRIQFKQLNIVDDPLPTGDLVLIRQVLQHLSNDEIAKILKKVSAFHYALITEHVPVEGNVVYNIDKIHGPHIRMKANSGVFIDKEPFNIKNTKVLFEYREDDPIKGKMVPAAVRTYLVSR